MKQDDQGTKVESGGTEGGRRPTGVAPEESKVSGPLKPGERWSLARKREIVLRMIRGEPIEALSRELGVEIYRLEEWREKALASMETGLKRRNGDPLQGELDQAMKRIGELTMENELLWTRIRQKKSGPLARRRSSK